MLVHITHNPQTLNLLTPLTPLNPLNPKPLTTNLQEVPAGPCHDAVFDAACSGVQGLRAAPGALEL